MNCQAKNSLLYLILSFSILLFLQSCKDESESIICNEQITCFIRGDAFIFDLDEPSENGARAEFKLYEGSIHNGNSISRRLTLIGRVEEDLLSINLEINVASEDDCIPVGFYNANTLDTMEGVVSINYDSQHGLYLHGHDQSDVFVEITQCDFENKTVSGSFGGTLFSPDSSLDFTWIGNGSFENICFEK